MPASEAPLRRSFFAYRIPCLPITHHPSLITARKRMHIWVDADACPVAIKEILFRAAERSQLLMTLVANKPLRTPPSRFIQTVQVPRGLDVADNEIARRIEQGDLVITADIPLAADIVERGGPRPNPRAGSTPPKTTASPLPRPVS